MPVNTIRRGSLGGVTVATVKKIWTRRQSSVSQSGDASDAKTIDAIRRRVDDLVNKIGDHEFDTRDLTKVQVDDMYVSRFATEKSKEVNGGEDIIESTAEAIIACLRWRKQLCVNDIGPEDFPIELFRSGIICYSENGDIGEINVFICVRRYKRIEGFTGLVIKFIVFCFEVLEKISKGRPMSLVIDMSGAGVSQVDVSLMIALLPIWLNYYPGIAKGVTACDLNWVCRKAAAIVIKVMPARLRNLLIFSDRSTLLNNVGFDHCPHSIGGNGKTVEYLDQYCPENPTSIEEIGKSLGISTSNIKKCKEFYSKSAKIE